MRETVGKIVTPNEQKMEGGRVCGKIKING